MLRLLAACWVALFHFNSIVPYSSQDNSYRVLCTFGYLGVPVFFIISGYCMAIAEKHAKTPFEFLIRRLFRIFPPYWCSLIVVSVCILFVKVSTGTNSVATVPKTVPEILACLSLYVHPASRFPGMIGVYWTLPYELIFYLVIFAAQYLKRNFKAWLIVILAAIGAFMPDQHDNLLFFFNEISSFLLGYSLFKIINKQEGGFTFILSFIGIIAHHSNEYLVVSLIVCLLIFMGYVRPIGNNLLSRLGDYSYSIYLIHIPIGIFLPIAARRHFAEAICKNVALNIAIDFIVLAIVIMLAKSMFQEVELPSIKLGKTLSIKIKSNKR